MHTETKFDAVINALIAIICLGAMFSFGAYMAYTSHHVVHVLGGTAVMAVTLIVGGSMLACVIPRRRYV